MYLIILSNSPAASFPDNKSSEFVIPLATPLVTPIEENWAVALLEISVPSSFYNVESTEYIELEYEDGRRENVHPKDGVYIYPNKLAKTMRHENFSLKWMGAGGFVLKMNASVRAITFSKRLSKLFGLPEHITNEDKGISHPSFAKTFDPWINHRVLLVHCSLVKSSQVNDKQYNLLQSLVPEKFHFHQNMFRSFYPPDYLEILGEHHTSLAFKITDIEGVPVKFRTGNATLLLEIVKNGPDKVGGQQ